MACDFCPAKTPLVELTIEIRGVTSRMCLECWLEETKSARDRGMVEKVFPPASPEKPHRQRGTSK